MKVKNELILKGVDFCNSLRGLSGAVLKHAIVVNRKVFAESANTIRESIKEVFTEDEYNIVTRIEQDPETKLESVDTELIESAHEKLKEILSIETDLKFQTIKIGHVPDDVSDDQMEILTEFFIK